MRLNTKARHEMRKRLDNQFIKLKLFDFLTTPRKGWLKSIRESLGVSSEQMAKFLGKTGPHILALEKRETLGTITLGSLEKAAQVLDCQLVYALIPKMASLEILLDQEAKKLARKIIEKTGHSMRLEHQEIDNEASEKQIEELAIELKQKLDPKIWSKK